MFVFCCFFVVVFCFVFCFCFFVIVFRCFLFPFLEHTACLFPSTFFFHFCTINSVYLMSITSVTLLRWVCIHSASGKESANFLVRDVLWSATCILYSGVCYIYYANGISGLLFLPRHQSAEAQCWRRPSMHGGTL